MHFQERQLHAENVVVKHIEGFAKVNETEIRLLILS